MKKMQLKSRLVFTERLYAGRIEALKEACGAALREGLTDEGFEEALLRREESFPTGLDTDIPLAIPHVADGCRKSFMAISTFAKPVMFGKLGGADGSVPAEMMLLFGVADPEEESAVFRKLASVLRSADSLRCIKSAKNGDEMCVIMKQLLGDSIEITN